MLCCYVFLLCSVLFCSVMLSYVMLSYVMLSYVILCYGIACTIRCTGCRMNVQIFSPLALSAALGPAPAIHLMIYLTDDLSHKHSMIHLTEIVHEPYYRGQLPKKSVNLSFTIANINNTLTDLCGYRLLQTDFQNTLCEINVMIGVQRKRRLGGPVLGFPGNSTAAYLVMQNRNLEYGERRCGFNTKHQSTKGRAPLVFPAAPCLVSRHFWGPKNVGFDVAPKTLVLM